MRRYTLVEAEDHPAGSFERLALFDREGVAIDPKDLGPLSGIEDVPGLADALGHRQLTITGIADIPGLQTALNGKQPGLTGVADVPGLTTALSLKQPTLTGFNEVPGLSTALAGKQSTIEKGQANGYASLGSDGKIPLTQLPAPGGGYVTFTPPAFSGTASVKQQNATGRTISLTIIAGVISNPLQNGHFYLEVAPGTPGNITPPADSAFTRVDGILLRNNQAPGTGGTAGTAGVQSGGPNIGGGTGIKAIVQNGAWYRTTLEQQAGYAMPTPAYVSANYCPI